MTSPAEQYRAAIEAGLAYQEEKVVIVPAIRWEEADEWAATIGAEHHLPVDMNLALAYQHLKRENARLTVALGRIQEDPTNARQIAAVALR